MVGDVKGKSCLILDDIIDTAGTLVKTADALYEAGAATVYAAASHAVLSGPAIDRIANSRLEEVVVTNTTTPQDVELFRKCGVKYLVTTTPILDGRSFGTNMMESALIALSGKKRALTRDEYEEILTKLAFEPSLQELN